MAGPVAIGDLKRAGKLLELGCLGCGRHLFVDPAVVGLPDTFAGTRYCGAARLLWLRCAQPAHMASDLAAAGCQGTGGAVMYQEGVELPQARITTLVE